MATEISPATDDDDAWLYGDNNSEEQRKEEISAIFNRASEELVVPGEETLITTNGDVEPAPPGAVENDISLQDPNETSKENEEDKDSGDDDDSDDDGVEVTIGDIATPSTVYPYGGTPVNLNIKRGSAFSSGSAISNISKTKGIDLDTAGLINGVSMYEFNLDTIEDKPWRKPGADITDYFNYGFNEDTWKAYCEKQRKLRINNHDAAKIVQIIPSGKDQHIPIATVNENSKYSGVPTLAKKAGPPPGRRASGSIDVICGANSSRRSGGGNTKENVIQVIGGYDGSMPPGMPPTHLPPPFIPPNLSVPPPGLPPGLPPPNIALPGHVPPYPDLYGNPIFTQPPPPVPIDSNSQYDEQFFTGTTRQYDGNSESQHSWANSPHRDRDRDRDRNRDRDRDKDRDHYWDDRNRDRNSGRIPTSEDDYKRRDRDDYDRRRFRDYRDRRDKDRYADRDHDRDRDRERDNSRERDRDRRHRDHKEREDRHKDRTSRRRHHHDEEEDHHSSRHKHKKSKRDKDETPSVVVEIPEAEPMETIKIKQEDESK